MAGATSLENALASLQSSAWSGSVYRVMLNDYPPDRENTQGARWNPPDVAAIYTCFEPAVCIAEIEYSLARQPRPVKRDLGRTLYEIEVTLAAVVDLAPLLPQLDKIGIGTAHLFADDMKTSQEVGRLVTWFGFDGLIVPSARSEGKNLVIYPGRTNETYSFTTTNRKTL
jgi:RES domain-containing protein